MSSISHKPYCKKGFVLRDSYKIASGECSQSRCIRKTGLLPGKSSDRAEKSFKKSKANAIKAINLSIKKGIKIRYKCGKTQVLRRGYTRKSYDRKIGTHYKHSVISPGCIKKRGKSIRVHGEPSTRIYIDKDDHLLSEFGYFDVENKSREERMGSLHKLLKHYININGEMASYNYIIKALNARYIVNKNTNPKVANIFKSDQKQISSEYKKIKKIE